MRPGREGPSPNTARGIHQFDLAGAPVIDRPQFERTIELPGVPMSGLNRALVRSRAFGEQQAIVGQDQAAGGEAELIVQVGFYNGQNLLTWLELRPDRLLPGVFQAFDRKCLKRRRTEWCAVTFFIVLLYEEMLPADRAPKISLQPVKP
jgi:hypothetical protein